MATEAEKVLDELKKAVTDMRGHLDEQIQTRTSHLADKVELIDKMNLAITELNTRYTELVVAGQRKVIMPGEEDTPEVRVRKSAFNKYLRGGFGESSTRMFTPEETRSLSSLSDADGGFLIPTEYEPGLLMEAFNLAEIRPVANVGTTGRDTVSMPSLSKPLVVWGNRGIQVSEQQLKTGMETLAVHDLRGLTLIHNNTLDDAAADIWAELSRPFSDAIAEAEDFAFISGSGVDEPPGILTDSRVLARAKVSGVAAALTDSTHNGLDALISVLYSLKKTYRRNARFAFNSSTEAVIRTIKDTQGRYQWQPPVQAGAPATLLGAPVINPEGMADIGANTYPILVGDFGAGYRIRDRAGITIQRLVERYAEYGQTGFLIKRRTGGKTVMAEAFTPVKIAVS